MRNDNTLQRERVRATVADITDARSAAFGEGHNRGGFGPGFPFGGPGFGGPMGPFGGPGGRRGGRGRARRGDVRQAVLALAGS